MSTAEQPRAALFRVLDRWVCIVVGDQVHAVPPVTRDMTACGLDPRPHGRILTAEASDGTSRVQSWPPRVSTLRRLRRPHLRRGLGRCRECFAAATPRRPDPHMWPAEERSDG